jgi:methyl-accepting chemotaxis protein
MRLTLGRRLGLSFGVILMLMFTSSAMTYVKVKDSQSKEEFLINVRVPTMINCRKAQNDINYAASKSRHFILAGTQPARREVALKAFNGGWENIAKDIAALTEVSPRWSLQENRDRLARLKEALPKAREAQEGAMNLAASGVADAVVKGGNEYADVATPAVDASTKSLGGLADSFEKLIQESESGLNAANRSMIWTMGITTIIALAVGIFVAIFLSRRISEATNSVLVKADAIAAGDLTLDDLKLLGDDEIGDLTKAR